MARKYKGLGVGGFCIPEKSINDNVTHREMQDELNRLREAISILLIRSHDVGQESAIRIFDLLKRPEERQP